jgi:hypothetical protein
MRLRAWRVVPLLLPALVAAACTRNPYVIGTICPPVGSASADAGAADPRCGSTLPPASGTLVVDLDTSGADPLGSLALGRLPVPPAFWLRGENATPTAWPADAGGGVLRAGTAPATTGLGAPFTDGTGAVGLPAAAPGYVAADTMFGAVGDADFALEVVLRALPGATVLAKQAGDAGWALRTTAAGALELDLGDGNAAHDAAIATPSTKPLISGAWYHCFFWVSRAAGGRVDCDGSAGALVPLPPLGSIDAPVALAAGGGAPIRVAHVAMFRIAAGGLGDPSGWLALSARRFATLTGVYPKVALGTALPAAMLRDSAAYVDLTQIAGRQLYLVGPDWPRLASRRDVAGKLVRGYLSEPRRARGVPADATAWQAAELTLAASATAFPDGEPRFVALAPTANAATHTISIASTAGSANQVFSFFVHRLTASLVHASAGTHGSAEFDLQGGVVRSQPAGIDATIEDWGGGVFRCTYAARNLMGPQTYAVRLVDDAGAETFAGAGAAVLEIGGLQVDDGLALAGSLLAADPQPPDHLTFVADDGNLPTGASGRASMSVLVPSGNRVNDQAILNINRDASYANQVQLYLVGQGNDAGNVKFWRLENGDAHWAFDGAKVVNDGARHQLTATWDTSAAHLVIDVATADGPVTNATPLSFNRIDVGFSQASSGALEGLVTGLTIGAM